MEKFKAVQSGVNWIGMYTYIRSEVMRTFRVITQTLVTPWISALLYIFIFGQVVGSRISLIGGVPYIKFVLPGILMMNLIMSAFGASSSSLYFARFIKNIEEMLVAPFSYLEMIVGFTLSAVVRAVLVGAGIYVIAIFFGGASIAHIGLFFIYSIGVAAIFSLIGILIGLWAKGFEQLTILSTFIITPLSFLGGMFYSLDMLPPALRTVAQFNPFFYFVDGIRYSMIGIHEANLWIGLSLMAALILILGALVHHLFRIGWRIRA